MIDQFVELNVGLMRKLCCAVVVLLLLIAWDAPLDINPKKNGDADRFLSEGIQGIYTGNGMLTIRIVRSVNWTRMAPEDQLRFAQHVVRIGLEYLEEVDEDEEFRYAYGTTFHGEKAIFYYDEANCPDVTIDEDEINHYLPDLAELYEKYGYKESDLSKSPFHIELIRVTNGVAHYNAHIAADFQWDSMKPAKQYILIDDIFVACRADAQEQNTQRFTILGLLDTDAIAFSWDNSKQGES